MNLKGIESGKNILLQMSQKSRMKGVLAQPVQIFSFLVKKKNSFSKAVKGNSHWFCV